MIKIIVFVLSVILFLASFTFIDKKAYWSTEKKGIGIIVTVVFCIVLNVLAYSYGGYLQYFFRKEKNTIILLPERLNIFEKNELNDYIYIYEGDNSESCWHDIDKNIYHVFIDRDVFSSDDESVEITGKYWNYPFNPDVYINGESVNVKSCNNNKAHDYVYLERQYFFKINFSIVPNKIYKMKIYCKDISENFNIVFHESEESLPYSQEKVYYTPNGTAYHKNKKCIALKNSEHVFRGTTEYVGKTECWLCCK